jgi:hypothetical protein
MDIFQHDGHLTDQALAALAAGAGLDEDSRLEIAEHLAFCDLCLQRYTDALTGTELLIPAHSCQETLWTRIRSRTIQLFMNRYAAAAAAVALALTMVWGSGPDLLAKLPALPEERPALSEEFQKWNQSLDSAMSGVNDFFDGLGRHPRPLQGGN